nr:MAG TPA: hypothetical protein [Caudoviricetes sp.]
MPANEAGPRTKINESHLSPVRGFMNHIPLNWWPVCFSHFTPCIQFPPGYD